MTAAITLAVVSLSWLALSLAFAFGFHIGRRWPPRPAGYTPTDDAGPRAFEDELRQERALWDPTGKISRREDGT
jgi:hypothetical protein